MVGSSWIKRGFDLAFSGKITEIITSFFRWVFSDRPEKEKRPIPKDGPF
jgi:hypothetical protein